MSIEVCNCGPMETSGNNDTEEWIKVPAACRILVCGPARLYEILANLEIEDPCGIIKTFANRSPGTKRGTRLFEKRSLERFMAWRYQQAREELERTRLSKECEEFVSCIGKQLVNKKE